MDKSRWIACTVVVLITLFRGSEGLVNCTEPNIDNCVVRDQSVILPNNTVEDGEDLKFVLVVKGELAQELEIEFTTTNTNSKEQKRAKIQPGRCTGSEPAQFPIENDDLPNLVEGEERQISCKITETGKFFRLELGFPSITQYESGNVTINDIRFNGEASDSTTSSYLLTVAVPPNNITVTGLDDELQYTNDGKNIQRVYCIAKYTRPAPEFHWDTDEALDLNMTVLEPEIDYRDFPVYYSYPGKAMVVTQPIDLEIHPWMDGKYFSCRVEHMAYNSSYTDGDKIVRKRLTVLAPPVPSETDLGIEGDFTVGEPATIRIPFHANPGPTSLRFHLEDAGSLGFNRTVNSSSTGRYTSKGWQVQEVGFKSNTQKSSQQYFAILEVSELEDEDRDRVHKLTVYNELGNTNYTFFMPDIQDGGLSGGAIAGIVIGCLVAVILVAGAALLFVRHKNGKKSKKLKQERRRKRTEDRGGNDNSGFQDVRLEGQAD